jgi:CheY-like chemotaxis protein
MSVVSERGHGTSFTIHLPRVEQPVPAPEPETAVTGPVGGSETILLVEDEDEVRAVVGEMLRSHGYTVLEARDGGEALHVSGLHADVIHLLVTDIVMPNMGGRELVRRLTPRRSILKVLYVSGYTDDSITDYGALDAAFLEKPFTSSVLARKVREVLDAPAMESR